MKEYKIGETFAYGEAVIEVKELPIEGICNGCFFEGPLGLCTLNVCDRLCFESNRSDGKNIIFVEKKGE